MLIHFRIFCWKYIFQFIYTFYQCIMCVMLFLYVKMDDENKYQAPLKLTSAKHNRPWADYRPWTMISYTLWYGAFRKKWLQNSVGALRSYGPLKYVTTPKIAIFCIFNTKTTMHLVISIHKTFTSLGASHITP